MIKQASISTSRCTTWMLIQSGLVGALLICLAPVLSLAADPVVEMPPMPGQVYHAQGQSTSEGTKTELPPELQQLDEQIHQDAAILAGDRPAAGASAPSGQHVAPVGTKKEGDVKAPQKNNAGSSNAGLIALVAAVGAAAVFVLRRRGAKS